MPSSSIIIPFRNLLSVLLFLPLVLSCRQDEPIPPVPPTPGKGETAQMTLSIRVPDFRAANTRAGVDEETIEEITVLLIAEDGGTEKVKVKYDVPSSSLHTLSGTQDTKFFSVPVTAGTYKRIALIANAQTELAGITAGSTYDALKQVEVTGRFGQGGMGANSYIPMYGEHAPAGGIEMKAGVSQTIAQALPLIRMMARVDIINPATSGAGTIAEEVYFVNPAGNGRVWVDLTTYNTGAAQSGYMNPTLPTVLQLANATDPLKGMAGTGSPLITYYLNEQPATSTTLTTLGNNRPCIVLQLSYNGKTYYYRLDYTWDGIKGGGASPYEKGKYMPILRNHRYIFTIKEVKGPGFASLSEAIESPENFTNHNIVVVPIVIDEAFTDITFNESGYFLAVTRTSFTLKGKHDATSTENRFAVRTNYPKGCYIKAYNANGAEISNVPNPWLKTSLENVNPNTVGNVQALTNGKGFNSGYLEVRAGRLYTKVNVSQIGKLPLAYVSEFSLAGGSQYGSRPNNASPTAAQTDANLRWASDHNNDQCGYYNWYVCTGTYDATYNPSSMNLFNDAFFTTGAGKGYYLPSRWEWTGIFGYSGQVYYGGSAANYNNVNEAIEVSGTKHTYANDYYSTGAPVAGLPADNRVCYALRYKKGTGSPNDSSPTSDFPLAADNSMCCAFRYERVGTMNSGNNTDRLKVQCVYVGDQDPLPDLQTAIAKESWWTSQPADRVVTRIFPATGYIYPSTPSVPGALNYRGYSSILWSSTEYGASDAWNAYFNSSFAQSHHSNTKYGGLLVRPFAQE